MATFCTYYDSGGCRSCELILVPYAEQIARKEAEASRRLAQAMGAEPRLLPTVSSPPQRFRNRAKLSVTGTAAHPIIGLLGETDLDAGRELLACPIHHPRINQMLARMPAWIEQFQLIPYTIATQRGELKAIIAFYSSATDQMYLRFVLRSKECVARLIKLLPVLQKELPFVRCVSANLQPIPHAILEGPEEISITAESDIDHEIGGVKFALAPQAFVQTNSEVAAQLYQTAAEWIAQIHPARMLELYCGQGVFSILAAAGIADGLAVEINASAVEAAQKTAARLGLSQLRFECRDATQLPETMAHYAPDVVLVNPPRRGLGNSLAMIIAQRPQHLLYSSCSIVSLAEDLVRLNECAAEGGRYRIRQAQIFDLFPHTEHFETLLWLEKTGPSACG